MHISLTEELERRVKDKVKSGMYNNASEVIRDALRFMDTHEEWIREVKLAQLRRQVQQGIDQLDQGDGRVIQLRADLEMLFKDTLG